jgi:transcriptional regulator GlxA family with amidase domain
VVVLIYFIVRNKSLQNQKLVIASRLTQSEKEALLLNVGRIINEEMSDSTVQSIAEKLGVSQRSLYRKFEEYDLKPGEMLRKFRQERVKTLLQSGVTNLDQISSMTGYSKEYLKKLNGKSEDE